MVGYNVHRKFPALSFAEKKAIVLKSKRTPDKCGNTFRQRPTRYGCGSRSISFSRRPCRFGRFFVKAPHGI